MTVTVQPPPTSKPIPCNSSAKSIFVSKTFWGIVFTTVAAVAPIVGERIDAGRFYAKDAAQIIVILCGAAASIIGRVEAGSVYTPRSMPGPNKSDFCIDKKPDDLG